MEIIKDFIKVLFPDCKLVNATENIQELKVSFVAKTLNSLEYHQITSVFDFLQDRDSLHLSVTLGESNPIIFSSLKNNISEFNNSLNKEYLQLEGEKISIVVTISKKIKDSSCTIYDLNYFVNTLKSYNTNHFFLIFSKLIESTEHIRFKVLNLETSFYTSTLSFSALSDTISGEMFLKRNEKLEAFKSHCHFDSIDNFNLLPNDFKLLKSDSNQGEFNKLLNRYSNLLSIIYLFDITSISEDEIHYKINGYKSIKSSSTISIIEKEKFDEYFRIYDWVYNGGNLNDKIGLARNIISLHFEKNGELYLQGAPFQSVKSSFKVYEKQNIKQYIEIRNKISDQLLDFNNRANKIVETFANGFQKNILALISFYISAIIIGVLSKGVFVNIFSLDVTILSLTFLFCSFAYFFISKWEIKEQKKRFENSYYNLKERYTDLLENNDIERILNYDKEFKEDVAFIDMKRKIYSWMWILVVLLLAGSTIFLFLTYNISQLYDSFLFKLIFGNACN